MKRRPTRRAPAQVASGDGGAGSDGDDDLVAVWARTIAAHAAPDEVDVAPALAAAFLRGGRDRRDLLRRTATGDPGAFGTGVDLLEVPRILQALEVLARTAPGLLSNTALANLLAGASLLVAWRSRDRRPPPPPPSPSPPPAPAGPTDDGILAAAERLAAELTAAGVPPDRVRPLAAGVLEALLRDPRGGAAFVDRIGRARR